MKNVLLVTSPTTDAPNAIVYALERAKSAGAGLLAVAVLDPDLTQRVATTLSNIGFVGEKVSDSVMNTLAREQRAQAELLLEQIGEKARKVEVPFSALVEEGDPSEVCGKITRSYEIESAVLVAEKTSWLSRLLSRSPAVRLPSLPGCEVKVMDD